MARGIPVFNEGTKEDTFIYKPEDTETEYLITASGANEMAPDWYNDRLFLCFIKMNNKNEK